jgi:hypothetical protein
VTASCAYSINGGLGSFAQIYLPEQRTYSASAGVGYLLSRRDGLFTNVGAALADTTGACPPPVNGPAPSTTPAAESIGLQAALPFCEEKTPTAQATESYRRALSRTATFGASGGVAASTALEPNGGEDLVIIPVAVATYAETLGRGGRDRLTVSVDLEPSVDIRTGLMSERLNSSAVVARPLSRIVSASVTVGWLQSVPVVSDPYPITVIRGGIDVRYHLDPQLDLGLGVQTFWQDQAGYGSLLSNVGYVTIAARTRPMKF